MEHKENKLLSLICRLLFSIKYDTINDEDYKIMFTQVFNMIKATVKLDQSFIEFFFDCVHIYDLKHKIFTDNSLISKKIMNSIMFTLNDINIDKTHMLYEYNKRYAYISILYKKFNLDSESIQRDDRLKNLNEVLTILSEFPHVLVKRLQKINFSRDVKVYNENYSHDIMIRVIYNQIDECARNIADMRKEATDRTSEINKYSLFIQDLQKIIGKSVTPNEIRNIFFEVYNTVMWIKNTYKVENVKEWIQDIQSEIYKYSNFIKSLENIVGKSTSDQEIVNEFSDAYVIVNNIKKTYNVSDVNLWIDDVMNKINIYKEQLAYFDNIVKDYSEIQSDFNKVSGIENINETLEDYKRLRISYKTIHDITQASDPIEWIKDVNMFVNKIPVTLQLDIIKPEDCSKAISLYVKFVNDTSLIFNNNDHIKEFNKLHKSLNIIYENINENYTLRKKITEIMGLSNSMPSTNIISIIETCMEIMRSISKLFYDNTKGSETFEDDLRKFINLCMDIHGYINDYTDQQKFNSLIDCMKNARDAKKFLDDIYQNDNLNVQEKIQRIRSEFLVYRRLYRKIIEKFNIATDHPDFVLQAIESINPNDNFYSTAHVIEEDNEDDNNSVVLKNELIVDTTRSRAVKRRKNYDIDSAVMDNSINIFTSTYLCRYVEIRRIMENNIDPAIMDEINKLVFENIELSEPMFEGFVTKISESTDKQLQLMK